MKGGKVLSSLTDKLRHGNYGFQFLDDMEFPAAQIKTIGFEIRTSTNYYLNALTRKDIDRYIFQYTISGWGIFEYKGTKYTIGQGQAFLAEVPGENLYYLPKESSEWEFIYITLYGSEVFKRWKHIIDTIGCVPRFDIHSPLIKYLFNIFKEAESKNITDCYQASGIAYQFLMELFRSTKRNIKGEYPLAIIKALKLMKENYNTLNSIEDIADGVGLSKYYFIRMFTREIGISPIKYITKVRIEKAVELLHSTDNTIDEIAKKIGYSNGNYFIKVFKSCLGVSPGEFRLEKKRILYTSFTL